MTETTPKLALVRSCNTVLPRRRPRNLRPLMAGATIAGMYALSFAVSLLSLTCLLGFSLLMFFSATLAAVGLRSGMPAPEEIDDPGLRSRYTTLRAALDELECAGGDGAPLAALRGRAISAARLARATNPAFRYLAGRTPCMVTQARGPEGDRERAAVSELEELRTRSASRLDDVLAAVYATTAEVIRDRALLAERAVAG